MIFRIIISIVAILIASSVSKVEAAPLSDIFNKVKDSVAVIEVEQKIPIADAGIKQLNVGEVVVLTYA